MERRSVLIRGIQNVVVITLFVQEQVTQQIDPCYPASQPFDVPEDGIAVKHRTSHADETSEGTDQHDYLVAPVAMTRRMNQQQDKDETDRTEIQPCAEWPAHDQKSQTGNCREKQGIGRSSDPPFCVTGLTNHDHHGQNGADARGRNGTNSALGQYHSQQVVEKNGGEAPSNDQVKSSVRHDTHLSGHESRKTIRTKLKKYPLQAIKKQDSRPLPIFLDRQHVLSFQKKVLLQHNYKRMELLTPVQFSDYELIDCGDFEKLERFGKYITIRPEPQAVWSKVLPQKEWESRAHIRFVPVSSSKGEWKKLKTMPDQWEVSYALKNTVTGKSKTDPSITFRLGLTSFKHVGIFPEQAVNWDKIFTFLKNKPKAKFLNLFAYTGGASLAARAAGAEVTHVDSIKQVVTWANDNMQRSQLDNIRWLVDDALKFVKKDLRRGNHYQGIILDPPAFGHGPNGEKWKLEDNIKEMMESVLQVLDPREHLLILNAYSLGFSALVPENLLKPFAKKHGSQLDIGELYLEAASGVKLPLGVWGTLTKH